MGPKKGKDAGPSKKTEKKKQDKIIEDKTFGLKNKNKSKVVQGYIKQVESTVRRVDKNEQQARFQAQENKKAQKQEDAFLNSLFKTTLVTTKQVVDEGVKAKSVLCEAFKNGVCDKGDECEFSHDLNIEFNQGTFDIYTDLRDSKTKNQDSEIHKIANEKEHKRNQKCQSNIICKFFMDAVLKKVYGWKWECPNGDSCHYKHCLPPGFVIPTKADRMQEEMGVEDYMDLEEQIDEERNRVAKTGTQVNDASFAVWKEKRDKIRQEQKALEETKKKSAFTGIELFKRGGDKNVKLDDDANAGDDVIKVDEKQQEEENAKEFDQPKGLSEEEMNKLNGVEINTDLFAGENLDDLDNLDDIDLNDDEEDNGIQEEEKDN